MTKKTPEQRAAEDRLKQDLRKRLKSLMERKIPASVVNGHFYYVKGWKEAMADGKTKLSNTRSTIESLTDACQQLERYK